jgi:spermidine/putrescine transport system ATP-binding protein
VEITFIHVTHDQEEAMTMADKIAVMNGGHIEQLGTPSELYESPKTAFVAGFLGVSNLIPGDVVDAEHVQLRGGSQVRVPRAALADRAGAVAVGIRPEKIELGSAHENQLDGTIVESAYVGVATQYIVETACGRLTVYVQNANPGSVAGAQGRVSLSWSPEATFVVDTMEENE